MDARINPFFGGGGRTQVMIGYKVNAAERSQDGGGDHRAF